MSSTYPAGNPIAYLFDDDDDARAEGEDGGGGDRGTRSVGDGLYDVAASSLRRSLRFGVSLSFYLPYIFGFFLLLSIAHLTEDSQRTAIAHENVELIKGSFNRFELSPCSH